MSKGDKTGKTGSYVYTMNRVGKVVPPKREILKDISLSFFPGAKIGVLGLNGAGKSTLLRIMAGVDTDFHGEARPQPGINVGYLPQEPELDESKDVRGNIEDGVKEIKDALVRIEEVYAAYADPDADFDALATEQAKLEAIIQTSDGHNLERTLEVAADALRLPPWEADVSKLSGGEKRRVALCKLLLSKPDMLLLDEPTNHLDAESVAWLERFLHDYPGTVVAITHDRYFLDNVAGWILELDRGYGIPYEGNYSQWLEAKDQRLEQQSKQEAAHQKAIKAELEWVRSGTKGRHTKSKARLQRFEDLNSQEFQKRNETMEIYIPPGPRLGDLVIEASDIEKSFGDKLLFKDLSFKVPPGSIVGVIGGNGAGKSTLFKMVAGVEKPDGGDIKIGETVNVAYVDQTRNLDSDNTVWEELSDGQDILHIGNYQTQSRAYVSRFNFRGTDQQKRVGDLSGGERNRLHLAKLLKQGANLLLLDEPTNDLDVETLRALEEAILAFPGCAIVISHDRWFLDRIATHILAFEGDSEVVWHEGNFSDYDEDLKKRKGESAKTPQRMKYKKLA
ncbi:energy-dependent translational throttle protein EttA [Alkalimarinus coralli]|uniref:energy-dependent translational throttle protein EttA n=1 Tax=Alkalimarinus coralli TaxID=2935863 RepID=UPI00202B0227|nr:energy-dependent translational throttle protein EttA [Alkalimarinus coralli]